jgi:hypothetical protein
VADIVIIKAPCDCKPPEPRPEGWRVVREHGGDIWCAHTLYATEAEAEKDAEEWQAHHDSLKRKPRHVGPYRVITTAQFDEMTSFDSCPNPVAR